MFDYFRVNKVKTEENQLEIENPCVSKHLSMIWNCYKWNLMEKDVKNMQNREKWIQTRRGKIGIYPDKV
jgi:hypothetical protein